MRVAAVTSVALLAALLDGAAALSGGPYYGDVSALSAPMMLFTADWLHKGVLASWAAKKRELRFVASHRAHTMALAGTGTVRTAGRLATLASAAATCSRATCSILEIFNVK